MGIDQILGAFIELSFSSKNITLCILRYDNSNVKDYVNFFLVIVFLLVFVLVI